MILRACEKCGSLGRIFLGTFRCAVCGHFILPQPKPEINYAVDYAKLQYPPSTRLSTYPTQCPASKPRRFGLVARLWWQLFPPGEEQIAEELAASRCHHCDGHWEWPEQREHENYLGVRWPVTAEDTRRLNP